MSPTLLLVLLHSTAIAGEYLSLAVREGHNATLPCETMALGRCYRTSWMYRSSSEVIELASYGRIIENNKFELGRLKLSDGCSLVVTAVTADDGGVYSCRDVSLRHSVDIDVSVVTMAEYSDVQQATFNCTAKTPGPCRLSVRWLYEGRAIDHNRETELIRQCSSTVTFQHAELRRMSRRRDTLECEVTDLNMRRSQLFSFSSSFGEHATTAATPTTWPPSSSSSSPTTQDGCSAVDFIMLVLRLAELGLITVITVLLVRAGGKQRRPDEQTVHRDDTVSYENVREAAGSVQLNTNCEKK